MEGDNHARIMLRFGEIFQSIDLITGASPISRRAPSGEAAPAGPARR